MRGRYAVEYFDEICRRRANAPRDRQAALHARASTINGPQRSTPQLMLKVVGWSKSAGAATRLASYVGRRENDRMGIALETSSGTTIRTRDELQAELAEWGILSNPDNRSAAWQKASPDERAAMPEAEALRYRQSVHMVVSLPPSMAENKAELQAAVRDTLADTFGAAGHRYMMAVHDHNGRAHVHIVAQVRSEPNDLGKRVQLRLGRDELDALRVKMAIHLQHSGLDITATRRADRQDLRQAVRQGKEAVQAKEQAWMTYTGGFNALPQKHQKQAEQSYRDWAAQNPGPASRYGLREYVAYVQGREQDRGAGGREASTPGPLTAAASYLARRAPTWYAAHGAEVEQRRARDPEPSPAPPKAQTQPERTPTWFGRFRASLSPGERRSGPGQDQEQQAAGPSNWLSRLADGLRGRSPVDPAISTARAPAQAAVSQSTRPPRAAAWTRKQEGYDALTPAEQDRAQRAYLSWSEKNPKLAERYDMRSYVAWAQQQEGEASQRRVKERAGVARDARATKRAAGAQMRLERFVAVTYGPERAERAMALFSALYRENPGAAIWTLNNRPEAFGPVVAKSTERFTGRGFVAQPAQVQGIGAPTPEQQARAAAAVAQRRTVHQGRLLDRSDAALLLNLDTQMPWDPTAQAAAAALRAERQSVGPQRSAQKKALTRERQGEDWEGKKTKQRTQQVRTDGQKPARNARRRSDRDGPDRGQS